MRFLRKLLGISIAFAIFLNIMQESEITYAAGVGKKNMTIMVYMVGSDLESISGNASMDLSEMAESKADTRHNNIIIYTGGASAWQIDGLSADKDSILKVTSGNVYVVDTVDASNMGEADTLSSFINYCYDNYKSDSYSLILWDHGGGAVAGFGYDENYDDSLTLDELQSALNDSVGKRATKLELAGFDACLMSSLEVADVLAPYANYMVASQETEPGWGWDYSFLSCLTDELIDGEKLGKEIIDSYVEFGEMAYELYPQLYCDLTLSCIDLEKYSEVEKAMDNFFISLKDGLTIRNIPQVSRACSRVKGFGEYSSNYSYGMLDSINLINQLVRVQKSEEADQLLKAIDCMVVYKSGNVEDANGISICYPNNTDDTYRYAYMYISEQVDFSKGYRNFISELYDNDKGNESSRSVDLSSMVSNVDIIETSENCSSYDVKLQINDEQLNNISKINAFIMFNTGQLNWNTGREPDRESEKYMVVYSGKNIPVGDDGYAHVYYADKALYARNALTEEVSKTPLFLVESNAQAKERRYTMPIILNRYEHSLSWNMEVANLQIYVNEDNPDGQIGSVIPYSDSDTPDKQLLCIDNYDMMAIAVSEYYIARDENGNILPISEWENSGRMSGYEFPCAYFQLITKPIENPECFYCMFVIYDKQGNAISTELIPLTDKR